VVRKVIRSGATEFRYQREDQPLPKIGRWREMLDRLLSQNEANSSRERLTLIRLFEELREHGYDGGYDAVRRYARSWAQERRQATAAAALAPSPRAASTRSQGRFHETGLSIRRNLTAPASFAARTFLYPVAPAVPIVQSLMHPEASVLRDQCQG
jgi:hypothetical protein